LKIFGLEIRRAATKSEGLTIDQVISRLASAHETYSGAHVTPENCMQSPTVHAIVTAISRRIATLPVKVMRTTKAQGSEGRTRKEEQPSHPLARLLQSPNGWQDRVSFWLDATSTLVRYGNFYAFKSRGLTGPIRSLIPLHAGGVAVEQDSDTLDVSYRAAYGDRTYREFPAAQILHARGAARDQLRGDSPIHDIREAIGLDIAAERMGASIFGNSALPSIVFKHGPGSKGFETDEQEKAFIESFQQAYTRRGRFRALVVPPGLDLDQIGVDNEKAQFLATRQYQRTVIAGAFGVPPHMVGDLSRGTFNNVEQQSLDFVIAVVLPYVRTFEAAMERALLTDEDRRAGIIIRFNLDAALRGDFKTRQEGLAIQRQNGIINANDWREHEDLNPISAEDGGDEYWRKGPSGQDAQAPGAGDRPPGKPGRNENDDARERGDDDDNA
jgi:HK97 family phage portal protein